MLQSQCYGMVGFQAPQGEGTTVGKTASRDLLRALYVEDKLTLAQAVKVAKPIDHAKAIAAGKVDVGALVAAGVDLHTAQVAYNRATGNGKVAKARARSAAPSVVDSRLAKDAKSDPALAKLLDARKAKRQADRAAKAGKVYSPAEIAALQAQLQAGR